ncbi:MAG: type II toxin-antitoxin system RelE/ParE family toxin [Hyphomonadaceae bacterium]
MPDLVILPAARDDLVEIGDFIARAGPDRAVSFLAEIEARMRQAAERPDRFPRRDDVCEGVRSRSTRALPDFLSSSKRRGESCPCAARGARFAGCVGLRDACAHRGTRRRLECCR